jgi:hypothetical protein
MSGPKKSAAVRDRDRVARLGRHYTFVDKCVKLRAEGAGAAAAAVPRRNRPGAVR